MYAACDTASNRRYSYCFDVPKDETWEDRKTFACVAARLPNGTSLTHLYYDTTLTKLLNATVF
jgi:hypothetical protein